MYYSKNLYTSLDKLESLLNKSLYIVENYDVPKSAYDKVTRNVEFIKTQVNSALSREEVESSIQKVVDNTYLPYADKLYDSTRWFANRVT